MSDEEYLEMYGEPREDAHEDDSYYHYYAHNENDHTQSDADDRNNLLLQDEDEYEDERSRYATRTGCEVPEEYQSHQVESARSDVYDTVPPTEAETSEITQLESCIGTASVLILVAMLLVKCVS